MLLFRMHPGTHDLQPELAEDIQILLDCAPLQGD
jgi:hypothetical protein